MSTYTDRKRKAERAEKLFERYAARRGYSITKSAIETWVPKRVTDVVATLAKLHPELLAIRFLPDYRMQNPATGQPVWIDAKSSPHVERQCFEHYTKLDADGAAVYLAIALDGSDEVNLVRVRDVVFRQDEWQQPNGRGSAGEWRTIDLARSANVTVVKP